MSKLKLEIITPNKKFFDGEITLLTFDSGNGNLQVLPGHAPMISVVKEGMILYKTEGGEEFSAYIADGFAEVRPDETVIFTNYCDYDTDITLAREKMQKNREREKEEHLRSISQQKRNRIVITRAVDKLKSKRKKAGNKYGNI